MNGDTICALATSAGPSAISVIRISGQRTAGIISDVFSKRLDQAMGHSLHFGVIKNNDQLIDEVLVSWFKGPHSYTGEDTAEISCHGSPYIRQQILELLLAKGCRMANPGEFTLRAYLNGKMDLSQAEAVADLIASESAAAHRLAMDQMRGGFSREIKSLREELVQFASLLELELDFSEEDVEFADRNQFHALLDKIELILDGLIESFSFGNVIRNGIPVAIVGVPNVGKSTLLNAILQDDRALVSDIAGTTRDTVEEKFVVKGVEFRFIDTAGLRETEDVVENMGIERTKKKIKEARIILYLVDYSTATREEVMKGLGSIRQMGIEQDVKIIVVANKIDKNSSGKEENWDALDVPVIPVSASENKNIDLLKSKLFDWVSENPFSGSEVVVSNARHHKALKEARESVRSVRQGIRENIQGDLIAIDVRKTLFHLGEIIGEVSTEDLLGNIFSKFCIGK